VGGGPVTACPNERKMGGDRGRRFMKSGGVTGKKAGKRGRGVALLAGGMKANIRGDKGVTDVAIPHNFRKKRDHSEKEERLQYFRRTPKEVN